MISDDRSAGLFDGSPYQPDFRKLYDVADAWEDEKGPLRKRIWQGDKEPAGMVLEREIKFDSPDDEDGSPVKVWQWFVRRPETPNEARPPSRDARFPSKTGREFGRKRHQWPEGARCN